MDAIDALFARLAAGGPPKQNRDFGSDPADAPFAALALPALAVSDPASAAKTALAQRMGWDQLEGVLPEQLKEPYTRDLRLEQERDRFKGAQESVYGAVARRMLPGGSAVFNLNEGRDYAAAVRRFQAGNPEEGDYAKIAGHERLQGIEKERSPGESVLAAVAHVPAILGEGAFAGKFLGAVGKALAGGAEVAAPVAGEFAAQASRLARAGAVAGRLTATTGLMPSMYLAEAGKRAAENGGDWREAKNIAPAFGMGMAQVAVLGSLQKFVTTGTFAQKVAGKTALGMAEQQAVDASAQALSDAVLEKAWKVETGYGLAGDVFRAAQGKENGAVKHALSQAAVFGIFSAMHSFKGNRQAAVERGAEIPSEVASEIAKMKASGFDKLAEQTAAEFGAKLEDLQTNTQRWGPDPTKEAAAEALKDVPEEFKPVAKKIIDSLPTAEEAKKLLDEMVNRSELADAVSRTEERGRVETGHKVISDLVNRDEARSAGRLRMRPNEIEPPTTSEPNIAPAPDPLVVLGPEGLLAFAKRSGWKHTNPDSIIKKAAESPSDWQRLLNAARRKLDETTPTPSGKLPEATRAPETAPEGPRTSDRPPEQQPPTGAVDRPAAATGETGKRQFALGEGRQTGEKTPQGETLTVHDITDASGNVIGSVKVLPSGGTLKVHWVSLKGAAATDKAAKGALGNAAVAEIYRGLAAKYPDAIMVKYVPAEGRLQAGKDITLERVTGRDGVDTFRRYKANRGQKPEPPPTLEVGRKADVLSGVIEKAGLKGRVNPEATNDETTHTLDFGGRELLLDYDPAKKSLNVAFLDRGVYGNDTVSVPKALRAGTVELLRAVRAVAVAARAKGLSVEYEAEARRHELYAEQLTRAGFVLGETGEAEPGGRTKYTWLPTGEPARADRKAAGLKPEQPPTLEVAPAKKSLRAAATAGGDAAKNTATRKAALEQAERDEPALDRNKDVGPEPDVDAVPDSVPEPVDRAQLATALDSPQAKRLDDRERFAIDQLAAGRTQGDIGADPKFLAFTQLPADGKNRRQLVATVQKAARAKLGIEETASALQAKGLADAAQRLAERKTDPGEMSFAPAEVAAVKRALTAKERAADEFESINEEYEPLAVERAALEEAKSRGKKYDAERLARIDAREKEITQRAIELDQILKGRSPRPSRQSQELPEGSRPTGEASPAPAGAGQARLTGRTPFQEEQYQKRLAREKADADAQATKQAEVDAKRKAAGLKKQAAASSPEDSLRKWVQSEGHLSPVDAMKITGGEKWVGNPEWAWLGPLVRSDAKSKLDGLAAQAAENGHIIVPRNLHDTDVLIDALRKNKKIGSAADAEVGIAFNEREAKQRGEYDQAVREGRIKPTEYTPGNEDIPLSRGTAAPPSQHPTLGVDLVTPARLNAEVNAIFSRVTGAKDYRAEPRLPGGANARADLRQRATTTSKMSDQDPFVTLEEAAHHLGWNKGNNPLPTGAGEVPADVYAGFAELNAVFGHNYIPPRPADAPAEWKPPHVPVNVVEGYASWVKLHAAGMTGKLTGNAKLAAEWAEKWTRDSNLMGPIDAVTPLFTKYHAQDPTQRAQGYGSSTGQPVTAPRTAGEVSTDLGRRFLDDIDNNLYPAERFEAEIRKAGGTVDPEKALSTVMAAARSGSAAGFAARMARDGVPVLTEDGRLQKNGPSNAEVLAGAKPEWLAPGPDGSASKAGAYHTARGVVSMRKKGYEMRDEARTAMEDAISARDSATGALREALTKTVAARRKAFDEVIDETEPMINRVSEEQFATYEAALPRWNAEPEFGEWARGYSPRRTEAFNAQLDFLASIGEKTKEDVQRWKWMFPDYTPTERVLGPDAGWNAKVPGKKGEKAPNLSRQASGSGEAIVDPELVYQQRLLKMAEVFNRNQIGNAIDILKNQPGAGPFVQAYEREGGVRTDKGQEKSEELRKSGLSGDQLGRALKDMEIANSEVYFRHEPWPEDGRKATYEYVVNGKITSVRIGDRALYDLITNQQVDAHQTARLLRAISQMEVLGVKPVQAQAQVVRTLATGTSAAFQFKNMPRDWLTFWRNTTDRASVWQVPGEWWKMAGRFAREFSHNWGTVVRGRDAERPGRAEEDPLWRAFADSRGDQLKQFAFERDNPEKAFQGIKSTPNIGSLVKDALNWLGSPELGPRFLEYKNNVERLTGRTQEQLRSEYKTYYDDVKAGRKATDPLTEGQKALLLNAAWEVTAPFPRQGTVTREFNKITPFFGPAVAGVSKAVRNWKTNPKGALYALGLVAGLRALHWALVKDEPWYDQLSANDKFNNFVVPTPWGPRRLPGPRDLDVAFGGTLVTALDAANGKDPRFKQLLEQSTEAVLPPGVGPAAGAAIKGDVGMAAARVLAMPAGPAGTVGVEMMMNKDWTGKPIVPRREEGKTSGWDQFTDHYGPYALKQLTGGRGELSLSGAGLNLVPRVQNLRESVDRMYDRIHELEVARVKATRAGLRFPQEAEWDRLQAAKKQVEALAAKGRGERKIGTRVLTGEKPEADQKQEIMMRQAEVARRALGQR